MRVCLVRRGNGQHSGQKFQAGWGGNPAQNLKCDLNRACVGGLEGGDGQCSASSELFLVLADY